MKTLYTAKLSLSTLFLAAAAVSANANTAVVAAHSSAPAPNFTIAHYAKDTAASAKRAERFVGFSVGAQYTSFTPKSAKSDFLYGATLQAGGYFSPSKPFWKNLLLLADVGLYTNAAGDRTDTLLDATGPYTGTAMPGYDLTRSILQRKSEQTNIPILLTLAYDFQPCENLLLRVGPTLGVTYISMKSKFTARSEDYTSGGSFITSDSESYAKSGSRAAFTYGLTFGATYALTSSITADLQYRFSGTEKLSFGIDRRYGFALSHQLNLGVAYHF